jgi:prepilin-type N-terminal cleavage/methylation domain-containing protein/prepilin-type processing-associated H-X9-DG protein
MDTGLLLPDRRPHGEPAETYLHAVPRRVPDGFTLLECLVVVACLSILAGLLFPVLAEARARGRRTACISNLRQLAGAYHLYLQDWDEQLVYWYVPAPPRPEPFGPRLYWTEFLQPYLRGDALRRDPSARPEERSPDWLADYVMATWGPGGQGTAEQPHYFWPGPPLSLPQVQRPAETVQWVDGRSTTHGVIIDSWTDRGWAQGGAFRHGRGSNAAFADGHARWLLAEEMQRVVVDARGAYLRYGAADR